MYVVIRVDSGIFKFLYSWWFFLILLMMNAIIETICNLCYMDYENLSRYGDIKQAHNVMMIEVRRLEICIW